MADAFRTETVGASRLLPLKEEMRAWYREFVETQLGGCSSDLEDAVEVD